MLAIQGFPDAQWDARVALLQRFVSAGQVIGLVAAGALAGRHPGEGFLLAGAALLTAGAIALASAPACPPRDPRRRLTPRPMMGGDAGISGPHHYGHHINWAELAEYLAVINRPLRWFLLVWLVAYLAMNGLATLFPVAATRGFGMDPILPSGAYAIGVAASLLLYAPFGATTRRLGGWRMLMMGLLARLAVLGILAATALSRAGWVGWLMLGGFAIIRFVWPALAVGANSLSVRLAPSAPGESVGLFNVATSLAGSVRRWPASCLALPASPACRRRRSPPLPLLLYWWRSG